MDADRKAILGIHARERIGHLKGDAGLVLADAGEKVMSIQGGKIETKSHQEMQELFTNYFAQVKYSSWDDVTEPAVNVSPDGRMAWAAIQIRARFRDLTESEPRKEHDFLSSWIATYQKEGSKWQLVAISSGCDPPCSSPEQAEKH